MKQFFTFLLSLAAMGSFSQNWSPVEMPNHYHYKLGTASVITHTLFADSILVSGNISTMYMNRVLAVCDTCVELNNEYCPGYQCAYLRDGHQFLNREVSITEEGVYVLNDPTQMILRTFANEGESWDFNLDENIVATIDSIREEIVFEVVDSVKYISLSNGRLVTLSKNHGILSFPDFTSAEQYVLCGISGMDVGERLPNMKDIFDFQPGDELMYRIFGSSVTSGMGCWDNLLKVKITDRVNDVDSITYSTDNYYHYESWDCISHIGPWQVGSSFYQSTPSYRIGGYPEIASAAPNALIKGTQLENDNGFINNSSESYARCRISNADGDYVIAYGNETSFIECQFYDRPIEALNDELLVGRSVDGTTSGNVQCTNSYPIYKSGLGLIYLAESDNFENGQFTELIGYIKDGDTTGTIYSDSFLLSIQENEQAIHINLFPNPVLDELSIQSSEVVNSILLCDPLGREVFQSSPNRRVTQLDVSMMPSGVYTVCIQTNSGQTTRRVLIE